MKIKENQVFRHISFESLSSKHPEKSLVRKNKSFFSYIRLRRVILLRSDIRLTPSDIALRAVKGEYNITETVRFQYHSVQSAEYH